MRTINEVLADVTALRRALQEEIRALEALEKKSSIDVLIEQAEQFFSVSRTDIFSSRRLEAFVTSRHCVMKYMAEQFHMSPSEVGHYFGRKNTSVLNALSTMNAEREIRYREFVAFVKKQESGNALSQNV
jgi:chromosomal replication initiation ATPase DnaA